MKTRSVAGIFSATPRKAAIQALHLICLQSSRQTAQPLLVNRQLDGVLSVRSDEKTDCVAHAQSLCGTPFKEMASVLIAAFFLWL